MSRSERGAVGAVSTVVCSALVVVGLGWAGSVTQASAIDASAASGSRDYMSANAGTSLGDGGGVGRDGTFTYQGTGVFRSPDGTFETHGSGPHLNPRTGGLADGSSASLPSDGVTAEAVLKRGPNEVEFDPRADGFGFANYGIGAGQRTDLRGVDSDSARAVLGDQAVCKDQAGTCVPTVKAKRWIDSSNKLAIGGQCFGMAAAALVGFHGKQAAGFSGPAGVQTLEAEPELQRSIATWQASQDTFEVENARRSVTANEATAALVDSFTNPQAEHFMLTVANRDPKTGARIQGHALVPFGVFRGDDGVRYIATYDPNVPRATTAVKVNPDSGSWTYAAGSLTYDGKGDLQLIPAAALETKPLNPDPDKDPPGSVDD